MRRLIAFFIRFPVWTNVLMLSVFLFGWISFSQMNYSFFPEIEPSVINVQVVFPGASPEEVEEGVVLKIEEALDGLEGVERVTSNSSENLGQVTVEVLKGFEVDEVLTDVKNAVDRINSFPVASEKPVIFEQDFSSLAISFVLYGPTDLFNLKTVAEELRDELLATPEISQIALRGVPNREISIEVSEANLRRFQLTFNEITNAVRNTNVNISGGKFDTRDEEILIRAYGRNYYADELKNIVVRGNRDGTIVYLRDVATVTERWEDVPDRSYFNGKSALIISVNKTLQEDILAVADRAQAVVAGFNERNDRIRAEVFVDQTISLRQRLQLLMENGLLGLILVVITLGFFMNTRISFWSSIGIPFSFAGMFVVAYLSGITINVISLFGMILVVGILVDDAIVVGENIFAHYERGAPPLKAAVEGTLEVVGPVFTSVSTTIIAFMPFFFLDGFVGKFIWHMALVVVASLAFSLIEVFFVLPAHLSHSKGLHPHEQDSPIRKKIENIIKFGTEKVYRPVLKAALRHRGITLALPIALFIATLGLMRGGFIGFTPFPFIDRDTLPVNVSLVAGRQEAATDSVLKQIETAVWSVNDEIRQERSDGKDVILGVKRDIGRNGFGESGSHTGQLTLLLLDGETRNMDSFLIANRIRRKAGTIAGVQKISYSQQSFFGRDVSVSLLGNDLEQLNRARDLLLDEMNNFPSVKDVTDSDREGRRELNIELKPRAQALGLRLSDVAGQVRQGFFGQEVQRLQRGRDELKVWVRYRPDDRAALGFLNQMRIRTPDGGEYPFGELATYSIERGITSISRLDRRREIRIEATRANVAEDLPPIQAEISEVIVPRVLSQVSGVQASYEGADRDRAKFQASFRQAFPLALLAMFIFLILVFRSYAQALLIFLLIPFGVMCAIWGHGIHGIQVTTLSIYGIIALSGIVINDSIVLVDQINRNLRAGLKLFDAVVNGAVSRLRPILLTTFTTAFGLGPIIFETSRQAQFLIPLAVSVAYGVLFGTAILLLVLPAGYLTLNSMRMSIAKRFPGKDQITPEAVEPAVREVNSPVVS